MKPNFDLLPGGWDSPEIPFIVRGTPNHNQSKSDYGVHRFHNLLSEKTCKNWIDLIQSAPRKQDVSIQGFASEGYNNQLGSTRTTIYSDNLAYQLGKFILPYLENKECNEFTPTDFWQNSYCTLWQPVLISPMFRCMTYLSGGKHFPHYDAAYIYPEDNNIRTLKSFVLYLTTCESSGATRFIRDGQEDIPIRLRNHNDWDREPTEDEIIGKELPKAGDLILFDHRICHDVQEYSENGSRIIVRGDIVYQGAS